MKTIEVVEMKKQFLIDVANWLDKNNEEETFVSPHDGAVKIEEFLDAAIRDHEKEFEPGEGGVTGSFTKYACSNNGFTATIEVSDAGDNFELIHRMKKSGSVILTSAQGELALEKPENDGQLELGDGSPDRADGATGEDGEEGGGEDGGA